ncbi:MAG: hypothetical protein ABJP82_22125 [Hyphomicrobiales bacterium]
MGVQAFHPELGVYGVGPSDLVDNKLDRRFGVASQDQGWVTEINYAGKREVVAYLCAAIDWFSKRVLRWDAQACYSS